LKKKKKRVLLPAGRGKEKELSRIGERKKTGESLEEEKRKKKE